MRLNNRKAEQLREIKFTKNYTKHAEGSILVEFGDTKVICNASIIPGVPKFLKGKNKGWLTAEYGMLPRATNDRVQREASKGGQSGRTMEIQRLIGRALRACVNLDEIGENTIYVDCDVIQADGGTRCASICGGAVAVKLALEKLKKKFKVLPFNGLVAAVSVGMVKNEMLLDLDYVEDSGCDTDLNIVMTEAGNFIEIQGTAEGNELAKDELTKLIDLGEIGIAEIIKKQQLELTNA